MSTLKETTSNKLMNQIENLQQSIVKVEIQIQCMRSDLNLRTFPKNTFDVRKKHLEGVVLSMQETIFFLEDMRSKIGVVVK